MKLQKFRWSKVYESTEEELTDLLDAKGLTSERWDIEALAEPLTRQHPDDVTVWCAEGSLTLKHNGSAISMQPGDALRIPGTTEYIAVAGISGCVCYDTVGVGKEATY